MNASCIAVCTDFSECSRSAIPAAVSLAKRFASRLLLLHQAHVPSVVTAMETKRGDGRNPLMDTGQFLSALQRELSHLTTDLAEHDVQVEPKLLRETSVEKIVEFLEGEAVDLLILSPRGAAGGSAPRLGSFAEKMLRIAPCPVLVYRDGSAPPTSGEFAPKRIYMASDLSRHGGHALVTAASWAQTFEATLHLHSVVEKSSGMFGYSEDVFDGWWDYLQTLQEEVHRQLGDVIGELGTGIDVQKSVTVGPPIDEILRQIETVEPDLVVTGTHGRAGIEDFLLGSVSRKVASGATCPVLVVRPERRLSPTR